MVVQVLNLKASYKLSKQSHKQPLIAARLTIPERQQQTEQSRFLSRRFCATSVFSLRFAVRLNSESRAACSVSAVPLNLT